MVSSTPILLSTLLCKFFHWIKFTEFNKGIDELEHLKIESDERLETSKKTIEQQAEKIKSLESTVAEHDERT